MKREDIKFRSGNLTLEGIWHWPDGSPDTSGWPAVAICHPHPMYGGDMDNNVVLAICEAAVAKSIAAFRFNFRGTGASEGAFDEGVGEQDDLRAAIALMARDSKINKDSMAVAGYSFGCLVATPVAASESSIKAVALVSPPLRTPGIKPLATFLRPKFIICGDQDFVAPLEELERELKALPPPLERHIIPGADHFWWGGEHLIRDRIGDFFSRSLAISTVARGPEHNI